MMDGIEVTKPAPAPSTPMPRDAPMVSCCATSSFPPDVVRFWLRDRRVLAGAGVAVAGSGLATLARLTGFDPAISALTGR